MTAPDLMLQNTREQVASSDLTRIGGLAGRGLQDAMLALETGQALDPRAVVRRGLLATPGSGMSVDLSAGEALRYDATVITPDVSGYILGRLDAAGNVILAAADPTNPRIDLIYGTITSVDEDQQNRLELQLPARTLTSTPLFKSRRPRLTLAAATGTPAASPTFPSAPTGAAIPLWYVYVPAASVAVDDALLMDARRFLVPSPHSRSHGRTSGLVVAAGETAGQISLSSGRATVDGAHLELPIESLFTAADIAGGALATNTQYHLYAVTRGMGAGVPVGKGAAAGVRVVLSTVAPLENGRPAVPVSYAPLFGTAAAALLASTANALYLGTLKTDGAGGLDIAGLVLNDDGTQRDLTVDPNTGGFPGAPNAWIREPELTYISASQVAIGPCCPVIRGVPGGFAGVTADMASDRATGEAAEAGSTWYYLYLRLRQTFPTRGGTQDYVARISTEAPNAAGQKPTAESGFVSADYLFAGSIFNNASSDIEPFVREGDLVLWVAELGVAVVTPATSPSRTTFNARVPATSRMVLLGANSTMTSDPLADNTRVAIALYSYNETSAHRLMGARFTSTAGPATDESYFQPAPMPVSAAGQWQASTLINVNNTGVGWAFSYHGYIERR